MPLWLATREAVKRSLDSQETARNDVQVDRAVEGATRTVEGELGRLFFPQQATYIFRRPPGGGPVSAFQVDLQLPDFEAHLFLDRELETDLIAADEIAVDGAAVDPARFTLLPLDGPPHNEIEFRGVSLGLHTGRPVSITGLWGYDNVTAPAGTLAAAVADTTGTTVDVSDASAVGVGDLLTVGAERMSMAARAMLATGQTLADSLAAQHADRTLTVADGAQVHAGEVLLVDAERMLAVEIAGNNVIVRRAWDGSVLAAHSSGAPVLALRRLTVQRGVLGTIAATHLQGAAVARQVYPGAVVAYTVAIAQSELLNEVTGQQQAPAGHTFGTVLTAARDRAVAACGRHSGGFA